MMPISSAIPDGLVWSKISGKHGYELKRNGENFGSLWRTSFWSSEFQAESPHGRWRFRRTGCFHTATEIVDSDSNSRIAILEPNWSGGGTLVFTDGMRFRLTSKGWWHPVWTVVAESGQPVLSIDSRAKTVELSKELYLLEGRLILLAMFAWYVMQQVSEDADSAAAIAVAVS